MMSQTKEHGVARTWEVFVSGPLLAIESSPPRLCEKRNDSSEKNGISWVQVIKGSDLPTWEARSVD